MILPIALVLESNDLRGSGVYSLAVEFTRPVNDAAIAALLRIAAVLEAAAQLGMFPALGHTPLSSHMRLSLSRLENERIAIFDLQATNLDLRVLELLRNMCQRLLRQGIETRELRLFGGSSVSPRPFRKPAPDERLESAAYPSVANVRFDVETVEFVDTRMRRSLVELFTPVTTAHVLRIHDRVAYWFDLLEAGAYAMPVGSATDVDCVRGDVEIFDEFAIEVTVNRFQCSEAAWVGLVNMLDTCWVDGSVISKLMIE